MAINYDPAAAGGAAFGNQDYDALKAKGHSDSEINAYIGGLDTSQVSNQYKERGGHTANDDSWKHNDDSYDGYIHSPAPVPASNPSHVEAKQKAINYDPTAHGGAAFGNLDYEHLKSQGNSDQEINKYLGTLDNSQVSNKYKERAGFIPNMPSNSNTFTTAAGYEMEKGDYRKGVQDIYDKNYNNSNGKAGTLSNAILTNFTKDGYLTYDSTGAQYQNNTALKEAGYKKGDMLWKPGSLDNLNGRKLTGRIGFISGNGIYHPEYEHDAINSSHKSSGNAGYRGEVGLGADQSAYNRQYEQNNDVTSGQVSQQLKNNGYSDEGISKYLSGMPSSTLQPTNDTINPSIGGNFGSDQSDFEVPDSTSDINYDNWQEQIAKTSQNPYSKRSNASNMNFSFNPYKFQQGQ